MSSIFLVLFWIPLLLLGHSYILYPLLMRWLSSRREGNRKLYNREDRLPRVTVLMAAYNEEVVLEQKIQSLFDQNYPKDRLKIYVGSDNSTDRTNDILNTNSGDMLTAVLHSSRQGKPGIINQLVEKVRKIYKEDREHLLLLTDASVMLDKDTVFHLAKHFKNQEIGMVDAHMTYTGMKDDGISKSENSYLSTEVKLKSYESKVWGQMIGPFGGCFMMRADLYKEVPEKFLVDDFFLAMHVLSDGHQVINELDAICEEPVTHRDAEEFKRKKRISTGNFQNLLFFANVLNPFSTLGFSFISHKVIRWLGPFFMALILVSTIGLYILGSRFWLYLLLGQFVWYMVLPLADSIFRTMGLNIHLLRSISYFNKMNLALFMGFLKFVGGVRSNIWQPTART